MSKVVTIPKDRNPFIVIVNGVKYSYQAGQEVDVPDAVADVIEKYENAKPKPDPNAGGGSASVIEPITITENGTYEAPNSVDGYNPIMVNVGGNSSEEWIGDGNTHIWITLPEGRTSPMLGVCPNGTVTVDWGDGTTPDVLTGTITTSVKWTPIHNYAKPGDYVITLTADGKMGFYGDDTAKSGILRYSSTNDDRNHVYQNALRKIELGENVTYLSDYVFARCMSLTSVRIPDGMSRIGDGAFSYCYNLTSVNIPDTVTSIGTDAFRECYDLASITIPDGVTSIGGYAFKSCENIKSITIPDGVNKIGPYTFEGCYMLESITIPDGVTSIGGYAFSKCRELESITIPDGVTSIGSFAFSYCYVLESITIPDGVTSIGMSTFANCYNLTSVTIPASVTVIDGYAFKQCYSASFYDFSNCTEIPSLSKTTAFSDIPADCEIRVPAALYDEWIAATNWTTYASNIGAV